jgi:D-xylose 1-dehydrogenase (NADP+, D-xylono-1,5-lactone-forming)
MLRWGILGPGVIAGGALAPAMRACGHDLAVVGSRSLSRAQAFAAANGVRRARGSYREVVEADDVDAVYIALPNDLHEEWAIAALEAGKHVLCEKPLATDAAAAGRMAAASATHGRLLMEALMTWFHPRTAALIELLRADAIGELKTIHAAFGFRLRDPHNYRARPESGGGALLDVGVYGVAASRWVARGEPEGVRAVQRRWATGVDGTTAALLQFPGGAVGSVHASFDTAHHEVLEIVGAEGRLRLPKAFTAGRDDEVVIERDGVAMEAWQDDPYVRMVEAFAQATRTGAPPLTIDDAVATAEVLDRIRTSAL